MKEERRRGGEEEREEEEELVGTGDRITEGYFYFYSVTFKVASSRSFQFTKYMMMYYIWKPYSSPPLFSSDYGWIGGEGPFFFY